MAWVLGGVWLLGTWLLWSWYLFFDGSRIHFGALLEKDLMDLTFAKLHTCLLELGLIRFLQRAAHPKCGWHGTDWLKPLLSAPVQTSRYVAFAKREKQKASSDCPKPKLAESRTRPVVPIGFCQRRRGSLEAPCDRQSKGGQGPRHLHTPAQRGGDPQVFVFGPNQFLGLPCGLPFP